MTEDRITTEGDNDCTAYPWWAIVDPPAGRVVSKDGSAITHAITGPFFSRAAANEVLEGRRHRFGPHAFVYCFSGHMSPGYRERVERGKQAEEGGES